MDGLHVVGMAEDEGDVLVGAEIGDPVPAEETLDADDQVVSIGLDEVEKAIGLAGDLSVNDLFAVSIEDTDVHVARVQVDPTVVPMVLGIRISSRPPFGKVL